MARGGRRGCRRGGGGRRRGRGRGGRGPASTTATPPSGHPAERTMVQASGSRLKL